MTLHPQAEGFLGMVREAARPPLYELEPPVAREASKQMIQVVGPGPEVASVRDIEIPIEGTSIGARMYEPEAALDAVIVYFHGGGWVLGDIESSEAMCRRLTNASGCKVLSVNYRLAPEHRYPTAVDDAFAALTWAAAELAPDRGLVVAGDSAGGNLAAVCALRSRDAGQKLDLQVLVYPVTDHDFTRPSYVEHGDSGYLLGTREMEWFWDHYAPLDRRDEPNASPLRAEDLKGLAPAIVVIDEYDPLRDEGLAYAERLKDATVPVELLRVDDMLHGFFSMVNLFERADEVVDAVGNRVRVTLQGAPAPA
jgi:acetyl esterase